MNISLQYLSLIIGSVVGVLTMLAIRNPFLSIGVAVLAIIVTETILRRQKRQ